MISGAGAVDTGIILFLVELGGRGRLDHLHGAEGFGRAAVRLVLSLSL